MRFHHLPVIMSKICGGEWLSSLESLDLPIIIGGANDLFVYQSIIWRAPKLSTLRIRCSHASEVLARSLHDSANEDGLVTSILFSHLPSDGSQKLDTLTELTLEGLDLSFADRTFANFIDLQKLHVLELYECKGPEILLTRVSASSPEKTLNLTRFGADFFELKPKAFEDFLRSFRGLRYLRVHSYISPYSIDWSCLEGHVETLKVLAITFGRVNYYQGRLRSNELCQFASTQCKNLQAFGAAMSDICMSNARSGEWGLFGETISNLLDLPKLKILRIFNWPVDDNIFFAPTCQYGTKLGRIICTVWTILLRS